MQKYIICTKARNDGRLRGFTFASDESPPEGHRYSGLRFQITHVYLVLFQPPEQWERTEYIAAPPICVERYMTDIVNCPGKTGPLVVEVLEKQFARIGLYPDDIVGGVGDGGGENEGMHGVHAVYERRSADYVRRRCFGHLPWRVADSGLEAMTAFGNVFKATRAVGTYLHDGCTWNRLKALAVQTVANGGLGLYTDGGAEYAHMFQTSPPTSMEDRPETTAELFKWIMDREIDLRKLVKKDQETRTLNNDAAKTALSTLQNDEHRMFRRIGYVLLKKALYLFYYIKGKENIALHDSFSELIDRARALIPTTRVDTRVLELMGMTQDELDRSRDLTEDATLNWVEVCVTLADDVTDAWADSVMDTCMSFHQQVSLKMATHLSLTALNMDRTTWLAARWIVLNTNDV